MRETHNGMAVTAGEFDALVEDLVATLNRFGVGKQEQDELLAVLGPLRADIVEVETLETGTPLPEAYKNAPPMAVA
jgi:hemoglobin